MQGGPLYTEPKNIVWNFKNLNTLFISRRHHILKSGVLMPLTQRPVILTMNLDRKLVVSHFVPTSEHRVKLWDYEKEHPLPEYLEKSMIYKPEQGFLLLTRMTPEKVSGWKILTSTKWADSRKTLRDSMIQNAIKNHMRPKRVKKIGRHWSFDSEIVTEENGLESTIHRCASFGYVEVKGKDALFYDFIRKVRSNLSIRDEIQRGIYPHGESIGDDYGDDVMVSVANSENSFSSGELKGIRENDTINQLIPGSKDTIRQYLQSKGVTYTDSQAESTFLIDVKMGRNTIQYASDRVFRVLRIEDWVGNLKQSMRELLRLKPTQFMKHSTKGRNLLRGFTFGGQKVNFGFSTESDWDVRQANVAEMSKAIYPSGERKLLFNEKWDHHLKNHLELHPTPLPEISITYCVGEDDLSVLESLNKYSNSVLRLVPNWKHNTTTSTMVIKGNNQTEIQRSISQQVANLNPNQTNLVVSGLRPSRPNANTYTWLKRELTEKSHVHQNYLIKQSGVLKAPDGDSTHLMNMCQLLLKFGRLPVPFTIEGGDVDLTVGVDIGRLGRNKSRPAMAVAIDRFGTVWGGNISSEPQPGEEMSERTVRDLFKNQIARYESETGSMPKRIMILRDGLSSTSELETVEIIANEYISIGVDILWVTIQKTGVPRLLNYDGDIVSDVLPIARSFLVTSDSSAWCWTTGKGAGSFPGIPRGFGFKVEMNFKQDPVDMALLSSILISQAKTSQVNPYSNTRLPFTLHLSDKMAKALARGAIPPDYSGKGFPAC